MYCSKCGNKIEEDTQFCNRCGNPVKIDRNNEQEKERNEREHWTKNWKKILISSIIILIVTLLLKAIFSNGIVFYILNIPLYLAPILFVVSLVLGIYYMKVNQIKWPIWFNLVFIITIIFICILFFSNIIGNQRRNSAQEYANEYSSMLSNRKIKKEMY